MNASRRVQGIAFLVFLAGLINIISALWADAVNRIIFLEQYVPMRVSNVSRTITAEIGLILIFLSIGLWQRKHRAWFISLVMIIPVLITHMIKGLDVEEAIANLVVGFILFRYRHDFLVKSKTLTFTSLAKSISLGVLAIGLYISLGFVALNTDFRNRVTINTVWGEYLYLASGYGHELLFPVSRRAHWFYDSVVFTHTLVLLFLFPAVFAPFVGKKIVSSKERDTALSLINRTGRNSVSPMAGLPDKTYFFNDEQTCFIAYKISGSFAIVLGDPIGYEEEHKDTIKLFTEYCFSCGLKPVWYNIDKEMLPLYDNTHNLMIGQEATIKLGNFSLASSSLKDVRNAVTKLKKQNVVFYWYDCHAIPWRELREINQIHDHWLTSKKMTHMTFSLDYFPLPIDQNGVILVGKYQSDLVCALSFYPYHRNQAYVLDLMLRSDNSPNGIMEAAIAEACFHFQSLGVQELNLSLAPLVVPTSDGDQVSNRRNDFLNRFSHWYRFQPLRSFKDKFKPIWRSKYLVYEFPTDLPGIALALLRVHLGKS